MALHQHQAVPACDVSTPGPFAKRMAPTTRRQKGKDTEGTEYEDVDQMWAREAGSKRQKDEWYSKGARTAWEEEAAVLPAADSASRHQASQTGRACRRRLTPSWAATRG